MFKENRQDHQESFFNTTLAMDDRVRAKLMKSWAPVFYENVFCQIDEKPFAVLYGTTGNPNFPVNILLSLEYIKHMKDIPDIELIDAYYFDYLVNYAVGLKTLGEKHLSERTLYYFRQRIYQYCLENPGGDDLLFGQFIKLLKSFAEKAG
ncbi:MAG: transposase, partial [Clostridiaceae bacterium]|nr:transposase [Clostridiaceae bacterium]